MAHIKYYGDLRAMAGRNDDDIEAESLTELLRELERRYGKPAKKVARSSLIVADGEKVLAIRKVKLQPGSEVGFFPMCCGG